MNRRHFITAASVTTLAILAGCKTEASGEKFVGYWMSDSKYDPEVIQIARNGDNFLFTVVTKDPLAGGDYQTHKLPAKLDESENILIVAGNRRLVYDEKADALVAGQMKALRATETQYQAIAQQSGNKP